MTDPNSIQRTMEACLGLRPSERFSVMNRIGAFPDQDSKNAYGAADDNAQAQLLLESLNNFDRQGNGASAGAPPAQAASAPQGAQQMAGPQFPGMPGMPGMPPMAAPPQQAAQPAAPPGLPGMPGMPGMSQVPQGGPPPQQGQQMALPMTQPGQPPPGGMPQLPGMGTPQPQQPQMAPPQGMPGGLPGMPGFGAPGGGTPGMQPQAAPPPQGMPQGFMAPGMQPQGMQQPQGGREPAPAPSGAPPVGSASSDAVLKLLAGNNEQIIAGLSGLGEGMDRLVQTVEALRTASLGSNKILALLLIILTDLYAMAAQRPKEQLLPAWVQALNSGQAEAILQQILPQQGKG